jgi:hypothetical protein
MLIFKGQWMKKQLSGGNLGTSNDFHFEPILPARYN